MTIRQVFLQSPVESSDIRTKAKRKGSRSSCENCVATRKHSSKLSFLELLKTLSIHELKCGENASYSHYVTANEMQDAKSSKKC